MDYNNMKAGYQGVKDDMRDMAYKLAGVKAAYKKGGEVSAKECHKSANKKTKDGMAAYAMGGAAKVRLDVATPDGSPKGLNKGSAKKVK